MHLVSNRSIMLDLVVLILNLLLKILDFLLQFLDALLTLVKLVKYPQVFFFRAHECLSSHIARIFLLN